MSENNFNKLFSTNLKNYLDIREKKQSDLVKYLRVSKASVSNWCNGTNVPRMDKVDKICTYLNIKRSDLITIDEDNECSNEETAELLRLIKERKELGILVDVSKDATPEDIFFVIEMVNRMKNK